MRAHPAPARLAALAIAVLLCVPPVSAQYLNHGDLTVALRNLAGRAGAQAELVTIATSPAGRAVQALRLGAADRPALLVIANAHGPHLVGSTIAMTAAARIVAERVHDSSTVWIIPRLNPDAAEAMFGSVRWARTGNGLATDDDHDQRSEEDGFDDLDGDGAITQLRLLDPNGAWLADSAEPRLLRRADVAKGEVGRWTVVSEGRDDDGDERYNEDPAGGTDVNRNFSYDYPAHGREAGLIPFSSPEARGLAEFLMAHDEIAAIYVLGPQDNLLKPWENRANAGIMNPQTRERAQEGTSQGGPLNSILRGDQPTFADMGRRFQEITGLEKGPASAALGGDVLSWAYFHFGRWAFGSRAWWAPDAARDTTARGNGARSGSGGSGGGSDPLADERNALRWFESQGIDAFAPWTAVTVAGERRAAAPGGVRPRALLNPPAGEKFASTRPSKCRAVTHAEMLIFSPMSS